MNFIFKQRGSSVYNTTRRTKKENSGEVSLLCCSRIAPNFYKPAFWTKENSQHSEEEVISYISLFLISMRLSKNLSLTVRLIRYQLERFVKRFWFLLLLLFLFIFLWWLLYWLLQFSLIVLFQNYKAIGHFRMAI